MVGSEDQLQKFLKGIIVQEGTSGTRFDHGQFEIKTFPIYAPLYCLCHALKQYYTILWKF